MMRRQGKSHLLLGYVLAWTILFPTILNAREHQIQSGDTVAKIARYYGVSQKSLLRSNHINRKSRLRIGDRLTVPGNAKRKNRKTVSKTSKKIHHPPWAGYVKGMTRSGIAEEGGVKHIVLEGQTIAMIARAYNANPARLKRTNHINRRNPMVPGQSIFISGAKHAVPVRTEDYQPHKVRFVQIKQSKRAKVILINRSGTVNRNGRRVLSRLLGYKRVHPRLVVLLQKVAERFPGHPIEIISGYRKPTKRRRGKRRSPHSKNTALDFRLQGVSNELLYEFVSGFDKVGAGYYPNSVHVHLDVRKMKALWTDVSKRGEQALYVEPGEAGHWDTVKNGVVDIEEEQHAEKIRLTKARLDPIKCNEKIQLFTAAKAVPKCSIEATIQKCE